MWLATLWWRTGDALENRQSVFLGIFIRQPSEKNNGCVGLRTKKKTPTFDVVASSNRRAKQERELHVCSHKEVFEQVQSWGADNGNLDLQPSEDS